MHSLVALGKDGHVELKDLDEDIVIQIYVPHVPNSFTQPYCMSSNAQIVLLQNITFGQLMMN